MLNIMIMRSVLKIKSSFLDFLNKLVFLDGSFGKIRETLCGLNRDYRYKLEFAMTRD